MVSNTYLGFLDQYIPHISSQNVTYSVLVCVQFVLVQCTCMYTRIHYKLLSMLLFAGVNAARDALLTFMVGGLEEAYQQASEYLSLMGKNVVHCGAVGTGQVGCYYW